LPVGSSASTSRGPGAKGARQGNALLLAAGEVFRIVPQALREADPLQPELGLGCGHWRCRRVRAAASRSPVPSATAATGSSGKTKPSRRPRSVARASSSRPPSSSPASRTEPLLGRSSPASRPSSVDLPEPRRADDRHRLRRPRRKTKYRAEWSTARHRCRTRLARSLTSTTIDVISSHARFLLLSPPAACRPDVAHQQRRRAATNILVFGDSLSAGYGIRQDAAWPALLSRRLQEKNLDYSVVNAQHLGRNHQRRSGTHRHRRWTGTRRGSSSSRSAPTTACADCRCRNCATT
jgi:hypothetical protein